MKKSKSTTEPGASRPSELPKDGSHDSAATQSTYRSLIDSVALSFVETDLEGTIIDCNPALAQMLAARLEEFKGRKFLRLVPEKWHESEAASRSEVIQNGVTEEYEIELCRKNDTVFPAMIKKWLHTDRHGNPRSIWMLVQDLTGGKKTSGTVYQRAALLLESQHRYRSLLARAPIGILTVDKTNRVESINTAVEELLGYRWNGIVGKTLDDFITAPDGQPLLVTSPEAQTAVARCHDGRALPVEITCTELRAEGRLLYTCFLQERSSDAGSRDALKQAHDELELRVHESTAEIARLSDALQSEISERTWAQEQFQVAVESAPNGILIVDPMGNISLVNTKIEQLFRYNRVELIGRSIDILLPERFQSQHAGLREIFGANPDLSMGGSSTEIFGLRRDGVQFPIEISLNPIHTPRGKGILISLVDATERKRAESELKRTAFHDALTGLPNRTLFLDNLLRLNTMAKRHGHHPFALLFLDLDRFKVINDSLGHMAGDKLLIEMAQRIVECTRDEDTVARLGGDEFAILVEQIRGPEDAVRIAERILERFADPLILDDNEVSVGASIGIALSMSGEEQPENLLRDADMAMYQAKTRRTGYQIFDARMHARALDRMKLEIDMKRAIERKQIHLHYQPIISLTTGRLAGFEALARWQHNGRGAISPAQFIPLAEETGLVGPLSSWVFREACQQMRNWRDRYQINQDVFISVNVSSKLVSHGTLIDEIDDVLNETGLEPHHLRLEITESAIVENARSAAQILGQLKKRHIKLCLDDFGKGFSSLNYLHRFPIDVLKIDRSFVRRLRTNLGHDNGKKRPYEIVRTIVALAQILGMQVVAEGVELADQLSLLKELGCEFGQGFLFSPGLDATDAARFMESGTPLLEFQAS
jgi:diguanylate cyclase (GGDEF)-like protein/PAS domain S-box-containing protein